jgi:predicted membrane channel-forming protein YqfA (hemolysin III family)
MERRMVLAYLLTAIGIAGTIIALVTEQSDYDPVAFSIASVSILIAVVGIALALKPPQKEKARTAPRVA